MKKITFILFSLILTFSCSDNKNIDIEKNINTQIDTLKYSIDGFNWGKDLYLLNNGKFELVDQVFGCTGGGRSKKVYGNYIIDSLELTLNPKRVNLTIFPLEFDGEMKKYNIKYGADSLKIKTRYNIINWETKTYLLSEEYSIIGKEKVNDFNRFSKNYNSGFEPKKNGNYLTKETEGKIIQNLKLEKIPLKWRNLFLGKPVSAKIIKIKKTVSKRDSELGIWEIEINKGSSNNIQKGMTLKDKTGNFSIKIKTVSKNKSSGLAYVYDFENSNIEIKTILKTKW